MAEAYRAVGSPRRSSIPIANTDESWEAIKRKKHLSGKSKNKNLESKGDWGGQGREKLEY